ncbi:MAG: DUF2141 domain-containing protein [Crocinitomicaceae bacterium]|nr:DUF2141 domain-containing protein [Crocinitomicaceae bacterium]
MTLVAIILSMFTTVVSKTADLTVSIEGLSQTKGKMHIGVYNKSEGFREIEKTFANNILPVKANTVKCTFKSIPTGNYAISVFQDLNSNGKMDKGLFGIPTEPYGFSSNPTISFGPPSYEDCKIILNTDREIKIKLN